ncbi:hypothetical protein CVT25_009697 [Psilocybe cyanescens]|uniref:J domain-containing protein n=1 Tax=Psilocybe cyanescens TaxID=93625 RepID=A0A409WWG7_PSICY|nr:hypothetical protein CVT25_009697 [Psilocybe cyanescens]
MHPNIQRLFLQLYYLSLSPAQYNSASLNRTITGCKISSRGFATISSQNEANGKSAPKNPYPYPRNPRPTPYQIFHLPVGASQSEIKARYYELVRAHHPDSHHAAQLGADLAHTRFRSIKAAYDFLRGRTLSPHPNARPTPFPRNFDPYVNELARRRRAYYASRAGYARGTEKGTEGESWGEGSGSRPDERTMWSEDGWRERLIFGLGMVTLLAGLFPNMPFTIASTFMPTSFFVSPTSSSSTSDHPKSPSSNVSSTSFTLRFGIDLDKGHREAVSALVQARNERETMGAERREGVRQRVREILTADSPDQIGRTNDPPPVLSTAADIGDLPQVETARTQPIQSTLTSDQPRPSASDSTSP